MKETISACITAGNEEKNIRRCLESVCGWTHEVVVVDSFSSDATVEICRRYTDRVYQHEWLGYIGQKNLIKDLAEGQWILFIDADEEASPELRDEIVRLFERGPPPDIAGYEFPRIVHYLGKWIRHGEWYPDIKLRLFRKGLGMCAGREPHDRVVVEGRTARLRGHLRHYTYDNISDQVNTLNRFSSIAAQGMYEEGRRFHWHDILLRPLVRFVKGYAVKRGFLDGFQGWVIAVSSAYSVFLKYAKLREIGLARRAGRAPE
ncbi:MAG: glycosyltransferase family 2 protein [Kiritimatiellae bacterium]|nr:glycosyltransferase family 2 protein [Kiritimatiellia bacterium]